MNRVLIIGSPGAGKSTLSRALAARTGLPLFHMDRIHWLPGWIERDRTEAADALTTVLAGERWIIDGNYGSSLPQRLARADTVILLDYPTRLCLWRAFQRWREYRGRTRPDMTEGCPENLNFEFFWYVLTFRQAVLPRTERSLRGFAGNLLRLRRPKQTETWLAGLS